jgi:exodeoxyribonuclease-1
MSADDIRDRLYTPLADLPEGESRVALKEVHLNRCPALVELKHVSDSELQRLGLDRQVALGNVQKIRQMSGLIPRVREVFHRPVSDGPAFTTTPRDPDQSLYDGFISDADKQQCLAIRHQRLQTLINMAPEFRDPRLLALWPRYLARNAPDSLSPTQRDAWTAYRRQRLTTDSGLSEYSIQSYFDSITELRRQHGCAGSMGPGTSTRDRLNPSCAPATRTPERCPPPRIGKKPFTALISLAYLTSQGALQATRIMLEEHLPNALCTVERA